MREYTWKWVVETGPSVLKESREFVSGLILNLALITGVVVFRWSLVEIAVIYLIEIAIINLVFLSAALFTPLPVDDLDGDAWDSEPTPAQPLALLPPVYWRNIKFVSGKAVGSAIFIGAVTVPVVSGYSPDSGISLSVSLAIAGIALFQLRRVWQHFIIDQSYRHKSPADAMTFAFAPVVELYLIFVYVVAPVTVVLVGIAFAMDTDLDSPLILLTYLIPMGVIRAWIGSLDPQTDDLELSFN
jgi:hypothetical protein